MYSSCFSISVITMLVNTLQSTLAKILLQVKSVQDAENQKSHERTIPQFLKWRSCARRPVSSADTLSITLVLTGQPPR
uniref:Secreted protein n=1 Tax=Anguilla anguilla TaxID=7936 RepID=A0A0E9S8V2_ANGAN